MPVFEHIKSRYTEGLDYCLTHPWRITAASVILLALSLVLIPFVGAEFMPKLDEGALWVRATMPYTISFDEAAKVAPKIRDLLSTFPEVTAVASELGRPDDGTDSTGFFNVGILCRPEALQPMARRISRQAGADRGDQQQAPVFPRHHLQLHPAGGRRGG